MADVFDFYVRDNRKITFEIAEPIMREDSGVTDFVFHIPKSINNLDMSDWQWWFVFVNANKEKYSIALTLSDDPESPLEKNVAAYTVDYAMSIKAGSVQFALEAINAGTGGAIDNEWHTLTYETKVKETLQGNQAEYAETESDIISALLIEVRNKITQLVGGATPLPVNLKSLMTDPQKVYLYTGSEQGEYTGNWYYHNGTQFVSGGVYGAGVTDAVPTQGSTNAVSSGGVYSALQEKADKDSTPETVTTDETDADFYLSDANGNVLLELADGHIKTKEFDSSDINTETDATPTENSTNAVQSGGVYSALVNKQDTLTFDSTPTENSTNPVTSGGVYSALTNIEPTPASASDVLTKDTNDSSDLHISDITGNALASFIQGGFATKKFRGYKYITYSAEGNYVPGTALTITLNQPFKKGDRIVIHIERNAVPWNAGVAVTYYAGSTVITSGKRVDCGYLLYTIANDVDNISAVFASNAFGGSKTLTLEVSLLGDIPIIPTVIKIKKDGSGDYTSLKACLDDIGYSANDILNPYRIEIYPGTYDTLEGFTSAEISTAVSSFNDSTFVGLKVLNGISLVGIGKSDEIVLTASLDTTNYSSDVRGGISTINLQGSGSIENLTIIAENIRYCVHDDFGFALGMKIKRTVKDCIFRGYNIAYTPCTTYGGGMPQGGADVTFIRCDFGENAGVHTNTQMEPSVKVHLINCKGHGFRVGDNSGISGSMSEYRFDNCDFQWVHVNMVSSAPHSRISGAGNRLGLICAPASFLYDVDEVVVVPQSRISASVGDVVEWYSVNEHGQMFRTAASADTVRGIVVYVDTENAYIQYGGYIRTDRLGLTSFSLNDYIGLNSGSAVIVASEADSFGRIKYIDSNGYGYMELRCK